MKKIRNLLTKPFAFLAMLALARSVHAAADTNAVAILSTGTDTLDAAKTWGIAAAGVVVALTFVWWIVNLLKRKGKM
jgi:hypothetical protein